MPDFVDDVSAYLRWRKDDALLECSAAVVHLDRPEIGPTGRAVSQAARLLAHHCIPPTTLGGRLELSISNKRANRIIRIPILPFNIVNAFLITSDAGCILVDAGIPGSELKIARVLARYGLSFEDIKLIIVTHAHTDHAGSAARLRRLSGAPILAHIGDADFFSRKEPMTYCPTGPVGRLFYKTPLPHQPYEGFKPDIMMKHGESVNLLEFSVDGVVRHAAGHTPGSITVELASKDALVGDLVASGILIGGIAFTGRAIRPPFEDDPQAVALELNRILERGAKRFYLGHGGPLEANEVARHARMLSTISARAKHDAQLKYQKY